MKKALERIVGGQRLSITETPQSTSNSATSSSTHPVGYETLFLGVAPIIADVIFVHGLGGHRQHSWTKDGICWPKDLLPKEKAFSNVRILTFGYDSNVGGHASLNSLFQHSISLVNGLCRERDDADQPIIFIAHSLGGLLVKDALHYSDIHRTTRPDLKAILDSTRGIVFLGTPHRGSDAITLLNMVAPLRVQDVNLIRDLERESQTLDRLGVTFGQLLDRRTFKIFSFEEELALRGKKVVDNGSAIIGDARERRDTIHADHVNMVKFSNPTDEGYRRVVYALRELLPDKGPDTAVQETLRDATEFYNVPPFQVPYYVERKGLFTRLDELLSNFNPHQSKVVLLGMGGTGKTQLALKYCRQIKTSGVFRGIFWLDASSRHALESSMAAICKQLASGQIIDDPRDGVEFVKTILSKWENRWLLVFDNFDNPSEVPILEFFPDSTFGSILLTSRSVGSKELGAVIELDRMEKDEGLELLLHSSRADDKDVDVVDRILGRLGYLPLAIDQVRAYISGQQLNLVDFEKEYERRKRNFMKETPQIWQYRRAHPGMKVGTSLSLSTTWEMSLELLDVGMEYGGGLEDVLTLFAFLYPFNISEMVFRGKIGNRKPGGSPMAIFEEDGEWDHDKFERAVVCMRDHSLVRFSRRNGDEIVVSLHSMVSEWLRLRLDKGKVSISLKTAALHLMNHLESVELSYIYRQEALSHMDRICRIMELSGESDWFSKIYSSFGIFYAKQARLDEAERMYNLALAGLEKMGGTEFTSTLGTINNLGVLYFEQGRLEHSERMYNWALAGYEKALGPNHTFTLNTVGNLGSLYSAQRRLADAKRMFDRAIAGYRTALGPEHVFTLEAVHNLGNFYMEQGNLVDAEEKYDNALAGKQKALGPEHTSTLSTIHSLGVLYEQGGRLAAAETMYSRALAGYEKVLGPEDTLTLDTLNNLGILYSKQWRPIADGEKMFNRAYVGYKNALGPEHSLTLDTVFNLGLLYQQHGHLPAAERMFVHALNGKQRVLGPDHVSTLNTVNILGIIFRQQGRFADAETLYNRALAGRGPEDTSALETVNNLGVLYFHQGRLGEAETMYKRALTGYKNTFGPEHILTLETAQNLWHLYKDQGRDADAESVKSCFSPSHNASI